MAYFGSMNINVKMRLIRWSSEKLRLVYGDAKTAVSQIDRYMLRIYLVNIRAHRHGSYLNTFKVKHAIDRRILLGSCPF